MNYKGIVADGTWEAELFAGWTMLHCSRNDRTSSLSFPQESNYLGHPEYRPKPATCKRIYVVIIPSACSICSISQLSLSSTIDDSFVE